MFLNRHRYRHTAFFAADEFLKFSDQKGKTNPQTLRALQDKVYLFNTHNMRAECLVDTGVSRHLLRDVTQARLSTQHTRCIIHTTSVAMIGPGGPVHPVLPLTLAEGQLYRYQLGDGEGVAQTVCQDDGATVSDDSLVAAGAAIHQAVEDAWAWVDQQPL